MYNEKVFIILLKFMFFFTRHVWKMYFYEKNRSSLLLTVIRIMKDASLSSTKVNCSDKTLVV